MSCVDSVSCVPVDSPTTLNSQKAPASTLSFQATQIKVSQSQTSDMTIVTAEGDTVTLSSGKTAELFLTTYNTQGHVGDSSATIFGASTELHRTSAFSITVDGDLNKEEQKDIRSAIRTMQKAANDVRKGHEEKAEARTAKLSDLDQIAGIDADFEFNREVSVMQLSAQSDTTDAPESTEMPMTAPAPTSDSQQAGLSQTGISGPVSAPVETPSTVASTMVTGTASTHLSVLIQTEAAATSANISDASQSGLWWFPSQDLGNILYPEKDSLAQTSPAPTESPILT